MSRIETLAVGVTLHCGDCLDVIPTLPAASIDACVCDPPYHLGFMGKAWDTDDTALRVAFNVKTWTRAFRVLKPGAHLAAFGGTRTFHRMMVGHDDLPLFQESFL